MNWTIIIREVHCGKDWDIEDGLNDPEFPSYCKIKNTGSHCLDTDSEGTHCEYARWCDVTKEFKYTNGDLIRIEKCEEDEDEPIQAKFLRE